MFDFRLSLLIPFLFFSSFCFSTETPLTPEECCVCFDETENIIPKSTGGHDCPVQDKQICRDCLVSYIKNKVDSGYFEIPCAICAKGEGLYISALASPNLYYSQEFLFETVNDDSELTEKLDRSIIVASHRKEGYRNCSNPKCDYLLHRPQNGTQCPSCKTQFKKIQYGPEVRLCNNCEAPLDKTEGCNSLFCVVCKLRISWNDCQIESLPDDRSETTSSEDVEFDSIENSSSDEYDPIESSSSDEYDPTESSFRDEASASQTGTVEGRIHYNFFYLREDLSPLPTGITKELINRESRRRFAAMQAAGNLQQRRPSGILGISREHRRRIARKAADIFPQRQRRPSGILGISKKYREKLARKAANRSNQRRPSGVLDIRPL